MKRLPPLPTAGLLWLWGLWLCSPEGPRNSGRAEQLLPPPQPGQGQVRALPSGDFSGTGRNEKQGPKEQRLPRAPSQTPRTSRERALGQVTGH